MVGWDWSWYLMSRYIGIPTGDAPGEAPNTGGEDGELVGVDSFTMRSRPAVHIPHNTQAPGTDPTLSPEPRAQLLHSHQGLLQLQGRSERNVGLTNGDIAAVYRLLATFQTLSRAYNYDKNITSSLSHSNYMIISREVLSNSTNRTLK